MSVCDALLEIAALSASYHLVWDLMYAGYGFPDFLYPGTYFLIGIYAALAALFIYSMDGFQVGNLQRFDLVLAQWIGMLFTNAVTYLQLCLIANSFLSLIPLVVLTLADLVICAVSVFFFSWLYHRAYAPCRMIMVYGSDSAIEMKIKMDHFQKNYIVDRLISMDEGLEKICTELVHYDGIVINDVPAQMRNDILKFCYQHDLRAYVVPKLTDLIIRGAEPVSTFDTPMMVVQDFGLTAQQRFFKRLMDIVISLAGVILTAPIMAAVAIAIKWEDGGPVFFKQKRVTQGGREFEILKFRSMIVDAEKHTGAVFAVENDSRITKVGHFIRAVKLDEIPQFFNILRGDMSIVGPRPERKVFIEEFCREMPEFAYRTKVKAGLTGYAQIYGTYNTTPYDKLRMDMMYISNYSLSLDIKLMLTTIRILFRKEHPERP